jgi:small subunit ribosomal protein S18
MEKTAPTESTQHLMSQTQHLIPTIGRQSSTKTPSSATTNENPDLDLEWMTASAQRTMADTDLDEEDLEDPFANLMPSDLNPAKKVNRRNAKPIPKQLLHHNNLSLLRRYVTPGGQIMNRIQSRLGAKDQRKVAKLVKRARHLGLIPVLGQWKFEDKGNVKDPSLWEYKDWEKRLVERGLVERKSSIWDKKQNSKAVSVGDSSTTVGVTNGW